MNKRSPTGRLFFPSIYRRKSLTTSSLLFFEKKIQQIPEIQQQNKTSPAIAFGRMFPSLVVKLSVAFLPQAFRIPVERIAPMRERMSSCLSLVSLVNSLRIVAILGS